MLLVSVFWIEIKIALDLIQLQFFVLAPLPQVFPDSIILPIFIFSGSMQIIVCSTFHLVYELFRSKAGILYITDPSENL